MKIKKLIILFFASLMLLPSFSAKVVSANESDENTVTIYTTAGSNNEKLGKEVGQLLSEPDVDRVRVIYTDLYHINRSKSDNRDSLYGWPVSFLSPYSSYEVGYKPIARVTGQSDGVIRMSQTKSVAVDVSGKFTRGLGELSTEFGSSLTETISIELSYEQRVPLDCNSMTVEAYPVYEVHHFIEYNNKGVREGSGTIKNPIGIVYEEIYN